MSRTKKGSKGAGYEYWSKRPYSGSSPGKITKKLTHSKERSDEKKLIRKEKKDLDDGC